MAIEQGPHTTGSQYTAAAATTIIDETNNVITSSGQTASEATKDQMAKALANYASHGDMFVEDAGSAANAYILDGAGSQKNPTALVNGMRVRFEVVNASTGASTANVGSLGAKNIFRNGAALSGGELVAGLIADLIYDSTNDRWNLINLVTLPSTFIKGLTTSNDTDASHDINVAAGMCRSQGDDFDIHLNSEITKQIDANWAAGDDAGGFPSALTLAVDTWYHFFVIAKPDGTVDAGFDTSTSATNLLSDATGYSFYRRIASVLTDSSSNIIAYTQFGDHFKWDENIQDLSTSTGTITKTNLTVSTPADITVIGQYVSFWQVNAATHIEWFGKDSADYGVNSNNSIQATEGDYRYESTYFDLITENSTIAYRHSLATITDSRLKTRGWIDLRGKE